MFTARSVLFLVLLLLLALLLGAATHLIERFGGASLMDFMTMPRFLVSASHYSLSAQHRIFSLKIPSTPPTEKRTRVATELPCLTISSGRVFVINARPQRELLHSWITKVIAKYCLVPTGPIDGSIEYL